MAVFFVANALWWAYRAGATISRAYLDWEAARNNTTLDLAFRRAKGREMDAKSRALLDFVQFNNQFAWTSVQEAAIDTAAVATAGLGLAAKIGLGKRVAAVLGIKSAGVSGALIDGLIDFTGAILTGQATNPLKAIESLLELIGRSEKALKPVTGALQKVVSATATLGLIISPFLAKPGPGTIIALATALPKAIDAVADLFGAIMSLWGVVEPLLPEPGTGVLPGPILPLDPAFRNALLDAGNKAKRPGFRAKVPRPRVKPRFDPETRMELPPEEPGQLTQEQLEILFESERRPDDIKITGPPLPGPESQAQAPPTPGGFFRRVRNASGNLDLLSIIRELKED